MTRKITYKRNNRQIKAEQLAYRAKLVVLYSFIFTLGFFSSMAATAQFLYPDQVAAWIAAGTAIITSHLAGILAIFRFTR
jgi:hypothetical protein